MSPLSDVTVEEFEVALTPEKLRVFQYLQRIYIALLVFFGLVMFSMVFFKRTTSDQPSTSNNVDYHIIGVTLVHFIGACVAIYKARTLFDSVFEPAKINQPDYEVVREEHGAKVYLPAPDGWVELINQAHFYWLTSYHALGTFGVIAVSMAGFSVEVRDAFFIGINMLGPVLVVGLMLVTIPTAERITRIFKQKVKLLRDAAKG